VEGYVFSSAENLTFVLEQWVRGDEQLGRRAEEI
jgi:hypothetical protein